MRVGRPSLVVLCLLATTLVAAGCGSPLSSGGSTKPVSLTRTVPAVIGQPLAQARTALEHEGFQIQTGLAFSTTAPAGTVVGQRPAGKTQANIGATVALTVSRGAGVKVPSALKLTLLPALARIRAAHLRPRVLHDYKTRVAAGLVYEQQPAAGARTLPNGYVTLYISRGHSPVSVPNVRHLSVAAAVAKLQAAGLFAKVLKAPRHAVSGCVSGQVYHTFPHGHATAPYHSTVRVVPCP